MSLIGKKVVPFKKTAGVIGLDKCSEWLIGETQGFLYVTGQTRGGNYFLGAFPDSPGNVYHESDFRIFTEDDSKEWNKISKPMRIRDVIVELDWFHMEQFERAFKTNQSLVCMSNLYSDFVLDLKLDEVKRLHKYLGEVIQFTETL